MMNWLEYFKHNRANRVAIPWERGVAVEPHLRDPLIRSLQRFQVGEQGDGFHLKHSAKATGDPTYAETISLFIDEEQEHSRLLAQLLRGMGAPLLGWHWSDACFVLVRRMSGLRLELMVLLAAELISKRYYRALYEGTEDPVLRATFAQISQDEVGHVDFHCDYLRQAFAPLSFLTRLSVCAAWQIFFNIVCLVVSYDHRGVLRATGVSPQVFRKDCRVIFMEAAAHIFTPGIALEEVHAE